MNKKILLTAGVLAAAFSPVVAAVSCGNSKSVGATKSKLDVAKDRAISLLPSLPDTPSEDSSDRVKALFDKLVDARNEAERQIRELENEEDIETALNAANDNFNRARRNYINYYVAEMEVRYLDDLDYARIDAINMLPAVPTQPTSHDVALVNKLAEISQVRTNAESSINNAATFEEIDAAEKAQSEKLHDLIDAYTHLLAVADLDGAKKAVEATLTPGDAPAAGAAAGVTAAYNHILTEITRAIAIIETATADDLSAKKQEATNIVNAAKKAYVDAKIEAEETLKAANAAALEKAKLDSIATLPKFHDLLVTNATPAITALFNKIPTVISAAENRISSTTTIALLHDVTEEESTKVIEAIKAYHDAVDKAESDFYIPIIGTKYQVDSTYTMLMNEVSDGLENPPDWVSPSTVYPVTFAHSNHVVKFCFENGAHWRDDEVKMLIESFAKNSNYGYGILTVDAIFITSKTLRGRAEGWGGAKNQMTIHSRNLDELTDPNVRKDFVQLVEQILIHEYGHHETLSLIDSSGVTQANGVVASHGIGYQMYSNTWKDAHPGFDGVPPSLNKDSAHAETARLEGLLKAAGYTSDEQIMAKFYGQKIGGPGFISEPFNFEYQMGVVPEFLNRVMNIIEIDRLFPDRNVNLFTNNDLVKYQLGEDRKFLNDDKTYTEAAQELVKIYGQHVYGYNSYGLKYSNFNIKGFSNVDFDFVRYDLRGAKRTVKVDKIKSHYITKDVMFGPTRFVNQSMAYRADIQWANGQYAQEPTNLEFYQDTNKNGVWDAGDLKVNVPISKDTTGGLSDMTDMIPNSMYMTIINDCVSVVHDINGDVKYSASGNVIH